ncbi:MAG: septum formation initiator family protein [Candidatus Hydrogenedentota bacterium]
MRSKTNGWYWTGLLAMFAGLTFYASEKNLVELYHDYENSEKQLVELDGRIVELEVEKARLERKIVGLDTDPLIVEMAIRKNTGHIRKGETIFRVEVPSND